MFKNIISGPRRSGKTIALMKLAVDAALQDNKKVLIIAPQRVTGLYQFYSCQNLLKDTPHRAAKSPRMQINLNNGSQINFINDINASRGFLPDFIAIDEYEFMSGEIYDAISPMIQLNPDIRIWMTKTDEIELSRS